MEDASLKVGTEGSATNIADTLLGSVVVFSAVISYVVVDLRMPVQLVGLIALITLALKERRAIPGHIVFFSAMWAFSVNLSLLVSAPSSLVSSVQALIYPAVVLMMFMARSAFYSLIQTRVFLFSVGLFLCLNSIIAILASTVGGADFFVYTQRRVPVLDVFAIKGFFFNVNYFLPTIVLLAVSFLMSSIFSDKKLSKSMLFTSSISILVAMLGFSRSAITALLFSFGIFAVLMRRQMRSMFYLSIAAFIFMPMAIYYFDLVEALKFAFRLSEDRGDFLNNREALWNFSLHHLQSNFFGFGDPAAIERATGLSSGYGEAKSVENTYLLQAMVGGYLGVIAYILLCLSCAGLFFKKSPVNYKVRAVMLSVWAFYFVVSFPRVITIGGLGAIPMLMLILSVASYRHIELVKSRGSVIP